MKINLLDGTLIVEVFFDQQDQAFGDNICLRIKESCPDDEKLFRAEESNLYLTPQQAGLLADALLKAARTSMDDETFPKKKVAEKEAKMAEKLKLSVTLPVKPAKLFHAWLDSKSHGEFTGDAAKIDPVAGGEFTAWDGYIMGKTLELDPPRRIVQSWRTTEFPEGAPDSRLEVLIEPDGEGSKLTLVHTNIPAGQSEEYKQGWEDYYFAPMKVYYKRK
jgi:activator of HSP90 ATPase